jgi:hypothetical protein
MILVLKVDSFWIVIGTELWLLVDLIYFMINIHIILSHFLTVSLIITPSRSQIHFYTPCSLK